MAHGKETPRQKMIGMMYLVLTAMLALNVSVQVLDAFVLVDQGLIQTNHSFSSKNADAYNEFDKAFALNAEKVKPWKDKADEIRKKTEELNYYIEQLKANIVYAADGKNAEAVIIKKGKIVEVDGDKLENKSNTDAGSRLMLGDSKNGEAYNLRKKLNDYRGYLEGFIADKQKFEPLVTSLNTLLNTSDPEQKEGVLRSWETALFESVPVAADLPILTKMQLDVLNCEAQIINYLLQQIDAGSLRFNKVDAIVIANSDYVLQGNEYQAQVFLAASDSTQDPKIFVGAVDETRTANGAKDYQMRGASTELTVNKGIGIYKTRVSKPGVVNWGGLIQLVSPDGRLIKKPFKATFQVAVPSIVVSPSKMNVLYRGVDNPVDISVAGVPMDKIQPSIDNGSIRRVGNAFVVQPGSGKTANISVIATIDNAKKNLGSVPFRIKNVPDPTPRVIGITSKTVDKVYLTASDGIAAEMPPDFDFDLKFTIKSFTISANVDGYEQSDNIAGWRFTDKAKTIINRIRPNQRITIENIKAVGPDGVVRDLNDINIKVK
jgi:gliding motility-associated protein GldM